MSRKRRLWTVADFALFVLDDDSRAACRRAKRLLVRLNEKHDRTILHWDGRKFVFFPATLARLEADLFAPIESIEFRLEALEAMAEEGIERLSAEHRQIASQTAQNTREIARLKSRGRAA